MDNNEHGEADENVEVHYHHLVDSLWQKGFKLMSKEDRKQWANSEPISNGQMENVHVHMIAIRDALNEVKSRVHAVVNSESGALERWRSYTSFTHPLRQLPRRLIAKHADRKSAEPLLCTQAYCKFVQMAAAHPELLETQKEGPSKNIIRSLHLCEAPGAFVLALKDCLAKQGKHLDWRMNSLNPHSNHAQMESSSTNSAFSMDDQFTLANQDRMAFGPDGSGDIFNWDDAYVEKLTANGGKFDLVTADGGFDCTDEPSNQEHRTRPLIAKQMELACACLHTGGNLLLKAYTFFDRETTDLLNMICSRFAEVHCIKPPSSKPGNSEVYLLCLQFISPSSTLPLSPQFLQRIEHCSQFFAHHQMRFMKFNLRTFRRLSQSERSKLEFQKCTVQEIMAEFLWSQTTTEISLEQMCLNGDKERREKRMD